MIVIACETIKNELEAAMAQSGCAYPVIWVESGLHEQPQKLKERLQAVINGLEAETALLAFGFCGNSAVGLHTPKARLILPRVADCIPLFLGSVEKREQMGAHTYFFTGGYLKGERNIVSEYARLAEKYDAETRDWLMGEMLKNYERFVVIDTGAYELAPVVGEISAVAEVMGFPVETAKGDTRYFRELLLGPWPDNRFLTVPPGGTIKLEDSLSVGASQAHNYI